ncbi:phage tail assembly chaperone [Fulvimarina sp. 2208YS6-2-32]|uniref:Phage tail assembly chaperone n=1 Tax=Fulvimarina uroteuthidis TaxID=3098149 RepID=A0ABU5I1A9_9HYPH|nr:phage tail assembly chaperone [Fulvimarina sp. 2208YS6-2-32]MDY8109115.1 phage tail assembly chaperone [Fulvimarina sp. 2208YS6-2-32]
MRFGFGILKLSPEAFWAMTPREIAAVFPAFSAFDGGSGIGVPSRGCVAALMRRFPD